MNPITLPVVTEAGVGWEDQGRQDHGWFGDGTSGNVPEAAPRPATADDLGRAVARDAAARLPPRLRAEFEDFTGKDGGVRLLRSMRVWAAGGHLSPVRFRTLLVGRGMTEAGAASLQAMARALADPHDPAALAGAGAHLAAALRGTHKGDLRFGLDHAQDKAVYAEVKGLVPDRPPPDRTGGATTPGVAAGAVAGPLVVTLPTLSLPRTFLTLLRVGAGAGSFVTFMFWPVTMGDGTVHRPPGTGPGDIPAPLPPLPSLVPPPVPDTSLPGGDHGPARDRPGEGGFTAAPALPHTEPGPAMTAPIVPPVVTMARPRMTNAEQRKRKKIIRGAGLPTGGEYPYVPPKSWTSSQPLPRGAKHKGYLNSKGREWVWPRGDKMSPGDRHWDVQLPDGSHLNVTTEGRRHHGK